MRGRGRDNSEQFILNTLSFFLPENHIWVQLLLDSNFVFSLNKTYFIRAGEGSEDWSYILFSVWSHYSGRGRRDRRRVSWGLCNVRNVSSSPTSSRQHPALPQLCQTSNFNFEAWTIVLVATYCFKALLSALTIIELQARQHRASLSTLLN